LLEKQKYAHQQTQVFLLEKQKYKNTPADTSIFACKSKNTQQASSQAKTGRCLF